MTHKIPRRPNESAADAVRRWVGEMQPVKPQDSNTTAILLGKIEFLTERIIHLEREVGRLNETCDLIIKRIGAPRRKQED